MATIEIDDETYEEHDQVRQQLGVSWEQYLDIGIDTLLKDAIDTNDDEQPAGDDETEDSDDTDHNRTVGVKEIINKHTDGRHDHIDRGKLVEIAVQEYGWDPAKVEYEIDELRRQGHIYEHPDGMFNTT